MLLCELGEPRQAHALASYRAKAEPRAGRRVPDAARRTGSGLVIGVPRRRECGARLLADLGAREDHVPAVVPLAELDLVELHFDVAEFGFAEDDRGEAFLRTLRASARELELLIMFLYLYLYLICR